MMITRFIPLTQEETLKDYPGYYGRGILCFLIFKDHQKVGLYGLIDRGIDPVTKVRQAEAFLTIFPAFRYRILSKGFFLGLFDHAFDSGFEVVYTWTRLPSWKKVFERFEALGIHRLQTQLPWDRDLTKVWFVKEKKK